MFFDSRCYPRAPAQVKRLRALTGLFIHGGTNALPGPRGVC
jgi:hypothetical protein